MKKIATGNKAIAEAVRQVRPDVVAAYPITPQSEIVETIADFVAGGQLESQFANASRFKLKRALLDALDLTRKFVAIICS